MQRLSALAFTTVFLMACEINDYSAIEKGYRQLRATPGDDHDQLLGGISDLRGRIAECRKRHPRGAHATEATVLDGQLGRWQVSVAAERAAYAALVRLLPGDSSEDRARRTRTAVRSFLARYPESIKSTALRLETRRLNRVLLLAAMGQVAQSEATKAHPFSHVQWIDPRVFREETDSELSRSRVRVTAEFELFLRGNLLGTDRYRVVARVEGEYDDVEFAVGRLALIENTKLR